MTAEYRQSAPCPKCGTSIPLEDAIGQWVRLHPELDSQNGFVFMDRDLIVHRWKTNHGRSVQAMMFVEVKTLGAQVKDSQRDTMAIIGQIMRNTRKTPTKRNMLCDGSAPKTVYSTMKKQDVRLMAFGYHLLRLSGKDPDVSDIILWDKTEIDSGQLVSLLKFDTHPDTLRPMDWRLHHAKHPDLFDYRKP